MSETYITTPKFDELMKKITLEEMLIHVDKLDVGDAKKTRIRAYVRKAYVLELQHKINLPALCKLSRGDIQTARMQLATN